MDTATSDRKRRLSPAQRLALTGECALLIARLDDQQLVEHAQALRSALGLRPDRRSRGGLHDGQRDVARVKRARG
jgi:hypothetical protein